MASTWIYLIFICCIQNHQTTAINSHCPTICNCSGEIVAECAVSNRTQLKTLPNITVNKLTIDLASTAVMKIDPAYLKVLGSVKHLVLDNVQNKSQIQRILNFTTRLIRHLTVKSEKDFVFQFELYYQNNTSLYVEAYTRTNSCKFSARQNVSIYNNCSITCNFMPFKQIKSTNKTSSCICKICSPISTHATNGTVLIPSKSPKTRHSKSFAYCMILACFSLFTLLANFFTLAKMCSCREQTVTRIFIMSLLLFNVMLSEYGIAMAAYLSQEDGTWDADFCAGMTAIKFFSLAASVFCLFLLVLQRAINPQKNPHYNKQDQRFKAIVYVLELLVVGAVCCIMAWTKFDNWGYLCSIWQPITAVDRLLVGIELSYYVVLFLVLIRYPYRKIRKHFQKTDEESTDKILKKDEKNWPVFVIVLFTFLIWMISYIITIPSCQIAGEYSAPLIRLCALLFAAALHPILLTVRHSFLFNKGCIPTKADIEEGFDKCECHGMQVCRYCEEKEMISRCDTYRFTDRRKSLSMDSLPRAKKEKTKDKDNKKEKVNVASKSYPFLDMHTIEESYVEDPDEMRRLLLEKGRHTAEGTPGRHPSARKESSLSLPLISSPLRHIFPGRKGSCHAKISSRQAQFSPEKKASLEPRLTSPKGRDNGESSTSDRSTTSTPIKSDYETDALLGAKVKCAKMSKSKRKRKDKGKSKDSLQSLSSPKHTLSVAGSRDSSCPTSPVVKEAPSSPCFRVSRMPSFIPLSDSCDSPTKKKGISKTSGASSPRDSPAKKFPLPRKASQEQKVENVPLKLPSHSQVIDDNPEKEKVETETQKEAENIDRREVSQPPEKKQADKQPEVKKPNIASEVKPKKRRKKTRRRGDTNYKECPMEQTNGPKEDGNEPHHGSMDSLEWDPSYSLSDSSPSPVDEFCPPSPAPAPSSPPPPTASSPPPEPKKPTNLINEIRKSTVSNISAGQGSIYSMDWDNTNLQLRNSIASQCDWEPYSADEQKSSGESHETSPQKHDQPATRNDDMTSPMRTDVVVLDAVSPTGIEVDTIKEAKMCIQP